MKCYTVGFAGAREGIYVSHHRPRVGPFWQDPELDHNASPILCDDSRVIDGRWKTATTVDRRFLSASRPEDPSDHALVKLVAGNSRFEIDTYWVFERGDVMVHWYHISRTWVRVPMPPGMDIPTRIAWRKQAKSTEWMGSAQGIVEVAPGSSIHLVTVGNDESTEEGIAEQAKRLGRSVVATIMGPRNRKPVLREQMVVWDGETLSVKTVNEDHSIPENGGARYPDAEFIPDPRYRMFWGERFQNEATAEYPEPLWSQLREQAVREMP